MSRRINKRISILRHIPPIIREEELRVRVRFSLFLRFLLPCLPLAKSNTAGAAAAAPVLYDSFLFVLLIGARASRKGKASAREPAAASFHAESKKLEKVDARLHANQVHPIPPYFVLEIANFLLGSNSPERVSITKERRSIEFSVVFPFPFSACQFNQNNRTMSV